MAHGLYTKRDFQISEKMQWHRLTVLGKPKLEDFPEIVPVELIYRRSSLPGIEQPMVYGNRKYVTPIALDDGLPVAPPYCGETIIDTEEKGCEALEKDKRGTYILFTPREAWAWVTELLAGTEYEVESIGMLWNRSFWFISVNLKELKSVSLGDGRQTNFQLNFSGGLDRTVSPQCELSSIVAVCHNTISLSRATGKVLFCERATKNFIDRKEASTEEVSRAVGMAAVFKATMDGLAKNPCTVTRAERIFAGFTTPTDVKKMSTRGTKTVKELSTLFTRGIGNVGQTEFDVLNAYTEFVTHGSTESKVSAGRRFVSSEFGTGADAKADFLKLFMVDRSIALDPLEERGAELLALV